MAIFRSKTKTPTKAGHINVKISAKDQEQYKMHTANVHDPILTAVNEDQPFEQAARHDNRRPSYLSNDSADLKDIFGRPIHQADMSNPTRERNERPLDTIRAFEYAITGDVSYREQLESHRLGWGFHEDFPYYNLNGQGHIRGSTSRPTINFDERQQYGEDRYVNEFNSTTQAKKKKRGLFGRKK